MKTLNNIFNAIGNAILLGFLLFIGAILVIQVIALIGVLLGRI